MSITEHKYNIGDIVTRSTFDGYIYWYKILEYKCVQRNPTVEVYVYKQIKIIKSIPNKIKRPLGIYPGSVYQHCEKTHFENNTNLDPIFKLKEMIESL